MSIPYTPECRAIADKPPYRRLRAYAFDPSLSIQLDTTVINNVTYKVAWEDLIPGPVGEYIEVVDDDPSSGCFYKPVNLDDHFILAQDGLDPDESNPQFHQQMVYAVAMTTIKNFELALGRKVLWSPKRNIHGAAADFVKRLRLYPHALREANAYYSPQKKAILFGYFNATPERADLHMPNGTVFTCLNHDIIAHEITHALLDGMHRRYIEATHPDSLAFHEALADIVALFQHFTFKDVLKQQIAKTKGNLVSQNLLGQLAQEFGKAIGHYGSLRDAIGKLNKDHKWEPHVPDANEYHNAREPHERGAVLVSTIFDAFLSIYKKRVEDLLRISEGRTDSMERELHPDLVNRMAIEAGKSAKHMLRMCIRALDYCPPVDINFGDYLRAIITADYDLFEEDEQDYRVAVIEAFQKRGIFPDHIKNMSVDSLLCKVDQKEEGLFESKLADLLGFFKMFKEKISYITNRGEIHTTTKNFMRGGDLGEEKGLHFRIYELIKDDSIATELGQCTGMILEATNLKQRGIDQSTRYAPYPKMEVHNLKLASRVGTHDEVVNQIVVTLTQRRGVVGGYDQHGNPEIKGYFLAKNPADGWWTKDGIHHEYPPRNIGMEDKSADVVLPENWFIFRGGSTLIFDLNQASAKENIKLKYHATKSIDDEQRMIRQFSILYNQEEHSLNATYFGKSSGNLEAEPFAIIHKIL